MFILLQNWLKKQPLFADVICNIEKVKVEKTTKNEMIITDNWTTDKMCT